MHSPPAKTKTAAGSGDGVPPSVQRAALDAADNTSVTSPNAALLGDLLQQDAAAADEVHHFDLWDGDVPPRTAAIRAEVHAEREQNVNAGSTSSNNLTGSAVGGSGAKVEDPDRISVVGDAAESTPPPPTQQQANFPPLNPFTPEWFAQIIGAAATAAATAVANTPRLPSPTPPPSTASPAPRRLNDRKVPDFWEDRPEFWFRIFDAHLAHFSPTEKKCFDALLPLLTPAARAVVHSVIRTPGSEPYSKARDALIRHFGKTPRQLARELHETHGMGDLLPSEFIDHLLGLLPNVKVLFEVMLLDALPANARVAALQHTDLHAMARAADAVVLENRAATSSDRSLPGINSLSLLDSALDGETAFQAPITPLPSVAAVAAGSSQSVPRKSDLCQVHARYGKEAYKCAAPKTCKMRNVIRPRPPAPVSGNAKAGSQ